MKLTISVWSIFLHFLAVILLCFHGSVAREMAREELMAVASKILMDDVLLQLHSMDIGRKEKDNIGMEMQDNRSGLHGHGDDDDDDDDDGDDDDEKQGGGDETRKREDAGHGHGHSSSHMEMDMGMDDHHDHELDPSANIFFTLKDLKPGKTLGFHFDKQDPASSPPPWLSKEEADSIPFSYSQLHNILDFFSFSPGSPEANAMEDTLRECVRKPNIGESRQCATSKQSMLDFVSKIFGLREDDQYKYKYSQHFRAYSTSYLTKNSTTIFQNYTILEMPKIEEIAAPKTVACHTMSYPYLIFLCHSLQGESKVFKVSLVGENGDRVDAISVCHMNTSTWSQNHISFRMLGIKPGNHVCHVFPEDNLVWVPTLDHLED